MREGEREGREMHLDHAVDVSRNYRTPPTFICNTVSISSSLSFRDFPPMSDNAERICGLGNKFVQFIVIQILVIMYMRLSGLGV